MNRIEAAVLSKTINYISNYIIPEEKIQVIEPLTCMMRVAILSFKPTGTKICIYDNSIYIQEPGFLQGAIRWISGDNRNDLHYLLLPITKALIKWDPKDNDAITNIYKLAIKGLTKLKCGYNCQNISSLTSHSIDLYINLIKDRLNGKVPHEDIDDIYCNINFFDKLWTTEQILLINNLFIETEKNSTDISSYLEAIENILSTKIRSSKEMLVRNIKTIN
jgi:hypothetical protein